MGGTKQQLSEPRSLYFGAQQGVISSIAVQAESTYIRRPAGACYFFFLFFGSITTTCPAHSSQEAHRSSRLFQLAMVTGVYRSLPPPSPPPAHALVLLGRHVSGV